MALVIDKREKKTEHLPSTVTRILPLSLVEELERLARSGVKIDEIRLRTGRRAAVTSDNENIALEHVSDSREMERIFAELCEYSLYAHAHTVVNGYLTLSGGVRVGIVGRAAIEGERVIGVYDVCALCFRLPRKIERVGRAVSALVRSGKGVLVYSPPGVGKTTLLRAVISDVARDTYGVRALRVAVVDTRGELAYSLDGKHLNVDLLSGYPRGLGIEIAARSMNAQLIVCDELSGESEAQAVIAAQNCGVPLLATAHASDVCGLLRRTGLRRLHEACVFDDYVGIRRRRAGSDYEYSVTSREEADAYL